MMVITLSAFAQPAYNTVSIDEIRASLPHHSINVGFDVDDTVLFSSPGFYYAFNNHDGKNGSNRYGKRPISSKAFWRDMNGFFDKFSMPKDIAKKLINMHLAREDKIIFITARPYTKHEILTDLLSKMFKIKATVIFAGKTKKNTFINNKAIKLFYGDSDSDIRAAHDAGIRGLRVLRSPMSTNKHSYHPGMYGESAVENSEN